MVVSSTEADIRRSHVTSYTLYKRRWYMLAVVVMFNISNALIWITFAPVANYSASYFNVTEVQINWFSLVFFVTFIPCCGLSWWALERFGFRTSVILGTLINGLGGIIRVIAVYAVRKPTDKFIVALFGQVLSACTQPLILSMPTKLAALWFGDHERTIANTLASLSNPVGILIATGIAGALFQSEEKIPTMVLVFCIPTVLAALMAVIGFQTSNPKSPPSATALNEPASFFAGIKKALSNKQFLLLALLTGCGIGVTSAIISFTQQLICPFGYNDTVASIAGALFIVGGLLGSACIGPYVDRTRKYIRLSKIATSSLMVPATAIIIIIYYRGHSALLIVFFTLFGACSLGVLPLLLELGVECTYPVDEATSSGIQWMIGQLIGALMMIGGVATATPLTADEIKNSACDTNGATDIQPVKLTTPVTVMLTFCSFVILVFVACFHTTYKRLQAEEKENSKKQIGITNYIYDTYT